ncbi:hypothetical protein BO94DRAFT_293786 [Aspergillus sclerotioniger CBS 115572]|uniref:Uncharacterized protein n=1 Tax=Aspergillus sclerotioniger CBS 115572 TaxID=1450535 RepID=A0A317V6Z8_9EURO|nr:hypothetical protein BO94DRAFT_293786 [Aspergillus sclerotioniger CBS 115572]PWY69876.1 hypothetical protein BO94DRAFT_293786 [Aspergillus sclerotioniger CBS 115572]
MPAIDAAAAPPVSPRTGAIPTAIQEPPALNDAVSLGLVVVRTLTGLCPLQKRLAFEAGIAMGAVPLLIGSCPWPHSPATLRCATHPPCHPLVLGPVTCLDFEVSLKIKHRSPGCNHDVHMSCLEGLNLLQRHATSRNNWALCQHLHQSFFLVPEVVPTLSGRPNSRYCIQHSTLNPSLRQLPGRPLTLQSTPRPGLLYTAQVHFVDRNTRCYLVEMPRPLSDNHMGCISCNFWS